MNKRELIEHINNKLFDNLKDTLFTEPTLSITESAKDNKVTMTFETEQGGVLVGGMLKKFEKVTIPQFVAEFIAEQKKQVYTLSESIDACMSDRVAEWYWDNSELFARAWLDGYEVAKEKRYIVKVKGAEEGYNYLNCRISLNEYFFSGESEPLYFRVKHTREMLEKAGFGWVFDCEGIEVKEVKE
ncbi:DUF1642 domain-containing protein [Streptococcus sp. KHUD_012]|uniref:DUF1642 domain-containing protein n=1 Tax=Streptococcus sp. KHUD_012 TaxID=3229851 RepID=UPI0040402807